MYVRIGRLHSKIARDIFKLLLLELLLMIINYLGIFSKTCLCCVQCLHLLSYLQVK